MFDSNPEVQRLVDALWDHSRNMKRGQVLYWGEVESITGMVWNSQSWNQHVINRFRRKLLAESKIVTIAVPAVGLRFLTDSEAATEAPRLRRRKILRQIRRACREVSAADPRKLTTHEQRIRAHQLERFRDEAKSVRAGVREIVKRSVTNPRRKEPEVAGQVG